MLRRSFLQLCNGLLSFAAFEQSVAAEAGVTSPSDLTGGEPREIYLCRRASPAAMSAMRTLGYGTSYTLGPEAGSSRRQLQRGYELVGAVATSSQWESLVRQDIASRQASTDADTVLQLTYLDLDSWLRYCRSLATATDDAAENERTVREFYRLAIREQFYWLYSLNCLVRRAQQASPPAAEHLPTVQAATALFEQFCVCDFGRPETITEVLASISGEPALPQRYYYPPSETLDWLSRFDACVTMLGSQLRVALQICDAGVSADDLAAVVLAPWLVPCYKRQRLVLAITGSSPATSAGEPRRGRPELGRTLAAYRRQLPI